MRDFKPVDVQEREADDSRIDGDVTTERGQPTSQRQRLMVGNGKLIFGRLLTHQCG